jgi:hypothetical protein
MTASTLVLVLGGCWPVDHRRRPDRRNALGARAADWLPWLGETTPEELTLRDGVLVVARS